MKYQWQQYQNILHAMVKPAFGCTEPIAAAYAAAVAASMLPGAPESISVSVSDNLYKNSMGVFVPGTGRIGLAIAAAVGAIAGNADAKLEVLAHIQAKDVELAQSLIDAGKVTITHKPAADFIYCYVTACYGDSSASVEICGGHTQITKKWLNGSVVFSQDKESSGSTASVCKDIDISIEGIYEYALNAPFEHIKFILEASELNMKLADEGLKNAYGMQVGRTIQKAIHSGFISTDLTNQIVMKTAAASDARMGGASLPAMSNLGSGNQGIAATLPVVIAAKYFDVSEEQLARALILSHLGAIYIKSYYPPLSAFCGNTVTSAATAMALVYLAGGNFEQSCASIQNVLSDCSGMLCDGAKATCAMKVKTSTASAVNSTILAMNFTDAHDQGIVAHDVEQSIRNIGQLVTEGMSETDTTIIHIMSA